MASSFKKAKVKLDLSTDINMLLTVKKKFEEEYVTVFVDMQKLITNTWKTVIKRKNCCIWTIRVQIIYMSQKLPAKNFEWIKVTSRFNIDFKTNIKKNVTKDIFWKLIFNILKNFMYFKMSAQFYLRGARLKKSKSLKLTYMVKVIHIRKY